MGRMRKGQRMTRVMALALLLGGIWVLGDFRISEWGNAVSPAGVRRGVGGQRMAASTTKTRKKNGGKRAEQSSPGFSQRLEGRVVKVADGDTLTVLVGKKRERIRLSGIDAPESTQAYGVEAREAMIKMVHSKDVVVCYDNRDNYQRIVGRVFVNGMDVGLEMLKQGFAWHYSHFDQTPEYIAAEKAAREARLGLWADPNPINPYEYRKMNKSGYSRR